MRFVRFIFSFYFTFIINLSKTTIFAEVNLSKCDNFEDRDSSVYIEVPGEFMDPAPTYKFRLSDNEKLNCNPSGRFNYSIYLDEPRESEISSGINSKGILSISLESSRIHIFPKDYCILSISNDELELSVCNRTCDNGVMDENGLCINISKCCSMNKILGFENGSLACGPPKVPLDLESMYRRLLIYETPYKTLDPLHQDVAEFSYFNDFSITGCVKSVLVEKDVEFYGEYNRDVNINGFRYLQNGGLSVCTGNGKWLTISEPFCIDLMQNFSDGNETLSGDIFALSAIHCLSHELNDTEHDAVDIGVARDLILYQILIPIGSVFLFLVIIVYVLLWDSQNGHGFTTLSYVCSLFFLYLSLIARIAIPPWTVACQITGVIIHFFFISTFCWLTAINFDIWWNFRNVKPISQSRQIRKYLIYCTLSCAMPIILITIGLTIDDHAKNNPCPLSENEVRLIPPNYGKLCAIADEAQGWYIYFPAGILIGCNLLFFGMTVYSMYKHKSSTNCVLEGNRTREDKPIWLFAKLFIVMGVVWIFEIITWALRQDHSMGGSYYWITLIMDAINIFLAAVAIFYVFVCKKRIFVKLWQEHLWLRCILMFWIKTGCCEIPPDRNQHYINNSSDRTNGTRMQSRKTSTLSATSAISKMSSSTV